MSSLSKEKKSQIIQLWRENCGRFPEKLAAQLVKLTAGQSRVDFVDVVWVIIEGTRNVSK